MLNARTLAIVMLLLVIITSLLAIADNEWKDGEEASDFVEGLGEAAAWGGGILILGFVAFREAFPRLIRAEVPVPRSLYRRVLRLHATSSLLLGAAAIAHGYMLRPYAGPFEYALTAVIVFTLISGVVLWLSNGSVRRAARMIHVQRILSALILVLLLAHVATIGD